MKWLRENFVLIAIFAMAVIVITMASLGKIPTTNVNLITLILGIITILAIYYAPIIALKVQKDTETFKERKERKLNIFKTLLATRANTISLDHVQALNMIDIEFYEENEIRASWNIYRDHLNSYPNNQDNSAQSRWEEKRIDYLTDLLYSMAMFFGYSSFDKVILKKGAYSPLAHGIANLETGVIRKGLVEVLSGNKPIPVEILESKK